MDETALTAFAAAAGRGDELAATELFRATQREVRRLLASLCPPSEIDDLTQETYLRVWRALPDFAGRSSVRTWLFTIVRRVAADHFRLSARRPRSAGVTDWVTSAETASRRSGARFDEYQALTGLILALAPQRREAFIVTQVLGLSYVEAARMCGCPVGTIRSRVARARTDLISAMAETSDHRPTTMSA